MYKRRELNFQLKIGTINTVQYNSKFIHMFTDSIQSSYLRLVCFLFVLLSMEIQKFLSTQSTKFN